MNRWFHASEQLLEMRAPLAEWPPAQVLTLRGQQIERDEGRRRFLRELLDARRRRMQPHLQRIEVEPPRGGDDDLAVDDRAVGNARGERLVQLGEVAVERPEIAALDV